MDAFRSLRTLLGAAACAACALFASHAGALGLRVSPIPIGISGGATSTMVELGNEGNEPSRMQAIAYEWTQTAAGEDKLVPTSELIVFPSMITIAPGATRKVRVGTQGKPDQVEKPFRVIFAELPPDSSPADGQLVKLVSHVSVPVFVTPPGAAGALKIESSAVTKDKVHFVVRDVGTAHSLVDTLRVETFDAAGKSLGTAAAAGWYVLPGAARGFDVDISKKPICAGAAKMVIIAASHDAGSASVTVDHPTCQ